MPPTLRGGYDIFGCHERPEADTNGGAGHAGNQ